MTAPTRIAAPTIAVAGATGEIGGRVAQLLAARGIAQRLPVRAARRAPRPELAEVVEVGGYEDRRGMEAAFEGIETFLLVPVDAPGVQTDAHRAVIEAAAAAGVQRIVQLSSVGADPGSPSRIAREHAEIEQLVKASGLAWTVARMNVLLDLLPTLVGRDGRLAGPGGDGRVAAVARDDVALALAQLLTSGGHDGRTYELTGDESLSFREIAAIMGRSCRQRIRFHNEPLASAAAPSAEIFEARSALFAAAAAGELGGVTRDVASLTGEPPMTLAEWLRAYPFSLVHVGALLG